MTSSLGGKYFLKMTIQEMIIPRAWRRFLEATPSRFCRDFGFLVAFVVAGFGVWSPVSGVSIRWPYLIVAVAVLGTTLIYPPLLRPLAGLWRALALLMHMLVSPVVLFILYYCVLASVGLVLSAVGWDPLRLKKEGKVTSYWVERDPPGPSPDSFKRQF
ncbi:MAG: hypothetical protein AB7P49_04755 [Bdellovibrionales bacterium]